MISARGDMFLDWEHLEVLGPLTSETDPELAQYSLLLIVGRLQKPAPGNPLVQPDWHMDRYQIIRFFFPLMVLPSSQEAQVSIQSSMGL